MKKKLAAVGIACGLSFNLAAEAPTGTNIFAGAADVLVIEEVAAPMAGGAMCFGNPRGELDECWAPYRAVVVARVHKGSARGTWL